jgi:hypothetical protein
MKLNLSAKTDTRSRADQPAGLCWTAWQHASIGLNAYIFVNLSVIQKKKIENKSNPSVTRNLLQCSQVRNTRSVLWLQYHRQVPGKQAR